jgi:SAM-dependent methyltransferase
MDPKYHEGNCAAWNQAAAAYRKDIKRTLEQLRQGGNSMCAVELPYLGDLKSWCQRAIHLQCAGGEDTLSLLNLGAREVIGIDISAEMLGVANETSEELNANAKWVCCDILETPKEFNETADLVYTGRGAVNWIHDLAQWGKTVARLLKRDGKFYMFEGHPVTYFFDMQGSVLKFDPEFEGYFSGKVYRSKGWTPQYIGSLEIPEKDIAEKFERAWPVSEVITALLGAGLRLVKFEEHPEPYWTEFPNLPESERRRFPNTYSILMQKN